MVRWCFNALYQTHIVAPRTPNSYLALRDTLQMSSVAQTEVPFPGNHGVLSPQTKSGPGVLVAYYFVLQN